MNLGPKRGLHTMKHILSSYTYVIAQVHVQKDVNSPTNCCMSYCLIVPCRYYRSTSINSPPLVASVVAARCFRATASVGSHRIILNQCCSANKHSRDSTKTSFFCSFFLSFSLSFLWRLNLMSLVHSGYIE